MGLASGGNLIFRRVRGFRFALKNQNFCSARGKSLSREGGSSKVKVPGDVSPAKGYFFKLLVLQRIYLLAILVWARVIATENRGHAFVFLQKFTRFGPSIPTSSLRSKMDYWQPGLANEEANNTKVYRTTRRGCWKIYMEPVAKLQDQVNKQPMARMQENKQAT